MEPNIEENTKKNQRPYKIGTWNLGRRRKKGKRFCAVFPKNRKKRKWSRFEKEKPLIIGKDQGNKN